ncbi:MAG: O-antigen polysaccharide polymerase Wzy [Cyanobacteria bacterium P01_A01_bin.84]
MIKTYSNHLSYLNNKITIAISIQLLFSIFLILFRLNNFSFESQPDELIYPFCCILTILFLWTILSWFTITKSIFNPYILFFLSAFIFNAGQTILQAFHLNTKELLDIFEFYFSSHTILDTLFLVTICLSSFHLGALINLAVDCRKQVNQNNNKNHANNLNKSLEREEITSKSCYIIGRNLIFISFLPALYITGQRFITVIASGYGGLYGNWGSGIGSAPKILADFIIPACLFLLAGSKNRPQGKIISATIVITYSVTMLLSGERNQAVMALASYAWLWQQIVAPLPKSLFIFITVTFTFLSPLIAAVRNTAGQDRFSIKYLLEVYSTIENPLVATIWEMGASMMTVAHTIELVPRVRDFQWGLDYWYALLTLFPSIFGGRHPTIARGLAERWLTEEVNSIFAFNHGTYGFTFIAEAYLNFGWVGAPIAISVIGFLFSRLVVWAVQNRNPAKMAMLASYISFFLFYARAESALILRALVWYAIFPYIWVILDSNARYKKIERL